MTVLDIINLAIEKAGISNREGLSTTLKRKVLGYLNQDYAQIYSTYSWDDIKEFNLTLTTTSGIITLPQYVDTVRAVRLTDRPLIPINEVKLNLIAPDQFNSTGQAYRFMPITPEPVETQPTTATTIKVVSTSTSDTSIVRVKGMVSGRVEYENLTLNGTTSVTSTNSYTKILQASKLATVGRVTISLADDTEIGYIQPNNTSSKYEKIQIVEKPEDSTSIILQCNRRFEDLVSDYDEPILPIGYILVSFLTAQCLRYDANDSVKADVEFERATSMLEDYFNKVEKQTDKDLQLIPLHGSFGHMGLDTDHNHDISVTGISSIYV